jgi:hypothetical protein
MADNDLRIADEVLPASFTQLCTCHFKCPVHNLETHCSTMPNLRNQQKECVNFRKERNALKEQVEAEAAGVEAAFDNADDGAYGHAGGVQ